MERNEADSFQPQPLTKKVEIVYGANAETFDIVPGTTFGEILADSTIRETLGYGTIKNDANVTLAADGVRVDANYVFKGTEEQLEVLRKIGEKA